MGQRVNIILAVEDRKGNKKVTIYNDQWGIGRKSLLNLLSIHHSLYNKRHDKSIMEEVSLEPQRSGICLEFELHYNKKGEQSKKDDVKYPYENFLSPEWIGNFIKSYCNNNNGAMVVHIKETVNRTWNPDVSFRVGFLLGRADEYYTYEYDGEVEVYNEENEKYGKAFSKWLSLEEWCSLDINSTYADKDFKSIIEAYMKYFEFDTF